MTDTTREEQKLDFLIRSTHDSHYSCEYRQDGEYRSSVKCGGCHHSQESYERSIETLKDFVQSEIAKAQEQLLDELETLSTQHNSLDSKKMRTIENFIEAKRKKELKGTN